ncbi:g8371 [Coccomyxa elongata]
MDHQVDPTKNLTSDRLLFVNSSECPFAQRTWIALIEKQVPYTKVDINLRNETGQYAPETKPAWFLQLNPNGKVPVLAYEEEHTIHQIYESNICNEFLEDFQPEPSLLPPHPAVRARARIIIARFSEAFVPAFYRLLLRQDKEGQQQAAQTLDTELRWLEGHFDSLGPYFMGTEFSLVDISLLPFFLRASVLQHYRGYNLPSDCAKLAGWVQEASKRASVQETRVSPKPEMSYENYLIWVYQRYADGSVKSTSAADFKD